MDRAIASVACIMMVVFMCMCHRDRWLRLHVSHAVCGSYRFGMFETYTLQKCGLSVLCLSLKAPFPALFFEYVLRALKFVYGFSVFDVCTKCVAWNKNALRGLWRSFISIHHRHHH